MRDMLDIEIEKKNQENNNITITSGIVVENKPMDTETTPLEPESIIKLNDQVTENQTVAVSIPSKPVQSNIPNGINIQKADKTRNPKSPGDEIPVTILYGTQTGTAEELAKRIGNELKKYSKFFPNVIDVEEYQYEKELKDAKFVVLVFATYGEGKPTDNAKDFYEWIRSEKREQDLSLSGVQYIVFGLGNKAYECYNETGRILDKRFSDLGARSIFPRGEGDDNGNLEEDFCKWSLKLYPALKEHFGITEEKKRWT